MIIITDLILLGVDGPITKLIFTEKTFDFSYVSLKSISNEYNGVQRGPDASWDPQLLLPLIQHLLLLLELRKDIMKNCFSKQKSPFLSPAEQPRGQQLTESNAVVGWGLTFHTHVNRNQAS